MVTIRSVDEGTSVAGSTITTLVEGKARFDDLVFTALPSSYNVPFDIVLSSINNKVVNAATRSPMLTPNTKRVELSFRSCRAGEIITQGRCDICAYGFFTMQENETQC